MSVPTKVAILPTYTCNNFVRHFQESLLKKDVEATVEIGGYHAANQELLDHSSFLFAYKPDFTIVLLSARSVLPVLYTATTEQGFTTEKALEELTQLLATIEKTTLKTTFILNTIEPVQPSPRGFKDATAEQSVQKVLQEANKRILAAAKENPTMLVFDFCSLCARTGTDNLTDEKLWQLGKVLLTEQAAKEVGTELAAIIGAQYGRVRKCLVVDLDNTLWGGVIGEDGVANLQLGNTKMGDIYTQVQQTLLAIKRQGTLLAIASKNNLADVLPIFDDPRMLLKKEDFAAMAIGWQPKSQGIARIAQELNLGIDSFAFLDDNPAERLEVAGMHPDVLVIDFPQDVAKLPRLLQSLDCFVTATMTKEDKERAKMYLEEKARKQLLDTTGDHHAYLTGLSTRIVVKKNDLSSLQRIAQLTNKTNQFNLRTARYTEAEMKAFMTSPAHIVASVTVFDRFGDMGLTGVIIFTDEGHGAWFVDTFLLSCRILGRDIELQFFQEALSLLPAEARTLRAEYLPTPKNAQVEEFYERLGFTSTDAGKEGKRYEAAIQELKKAPISWIEVQHES